MNSRLYKKWTNCVFKRVILYGLKSYRTIRVQLTFWRHSRFIESRLAPLLAFNFLRISLFCWWTRHKSPRMSASAKCLRSIWLFSIRSVSAYAIPLNPSMLFIFSIAFGRLRFLYQWPDMFGYKSAVFLFWHRQSVFPYTILTSNTGYVICKGHLWRSLLLTDGLAAV